MWFKNLSIFRLPTDFVITPEDLEEKLSQFPLTSPGPLAMESRGFITPFSHDDAAMVLGSGSASLFCVGTESRLLPASVLQDAVSERVKQHEFQTGKLPGKRLRNEFRDAALGELLPRAFIVKARTQVYIDPDSRMVAADTASAKAAEEVITAIRDALGSFPVRPLASESSVTLLMSKWLISGQLPAGFEFGDECKLEDPSDTASVISGKHHNLETDEIKEHVRCGKQVIELGLIFDCRIGFVLDSQLRLRKLRFLDVIADKLDAQDGADPDQILDAEFALMSLELRRLYARLDEVLRFVD